MGLVYQTAKDLIKDYSEETVRWSAAVIEPGKPEVEVKAAALSKVEAEAIILKLDQLAMSRQHEGIAAMVGEEAASILLAVRMVKLETKQSFQGVLGAGAALDIMWLRAEQIGGPLLDAANAVATTGPWQNGLTNWLMPLTAGTDDYIIDPQSMAEEAALVHLGAIDPVEVPKVEAVQFYLAAIPTPAQVTPFIVRDCLGSERLSFVRWEKPVICGPEKNHAINCAPYISGDTKMQLLSLLIGRAQDLTL